MDMDHELKRAKRLLSGIVLFIVSCFFAFGEGVYLIEGRETTAQITNVALVTTHGRSGPSKHLRVDIAFVGSNGTQRTGNDTISTDWVPPATGNVTVRYTPGIDGRARTAGRLSGRLERF
jgi:hypothetical protein